MNTNFKFIYKLILLAILLAPLSGGCDLPPVVAIPFQYVSTSDPEVVSVANFAVQQIGRGSLSSIVAAEKQVSIDTVYALILDLVDAHIRHHHYSVEVLVPQDGSAWQVLTFTATNY